MLRVVLPPLTPPAGPQARVWNGRDEGGRPVPSGTYLYRLTVEDVTATQSVVLLR